MNDPRQQILHRLIREYGPRLLPVARSFSGGMEEAEDILQETWLRALRGFDRMPSNEAVGAWLYRITLNVGRGVARRRSRRRNLLRRWRASLDEETDGAHDLNLENHQVRSRLWLRIAELPSLQQRVLLLRIVDGLSTAETARELDRAEGTVKASLHRALGRLRTDLDMDLGKAESDGSGDNEEEDNGRE
jgi:RNA polymerase sigma-70 factor (ECF subfamily)